MAQFHDCPDCLRYAVPLDRGVCGNCGWNAPIQVLAAWKQERALTVLAEAQHAENQAPISSEPDLRVLEDRPDFSVEDLQDGLVYGIPASKLSFYNSMKYTVWNNPMPNISLFYQIWKRTRFVLKALNDDGLRDLFLLLNNIRPDYKSIRLPFSNEALVKIERSGGFFEGLLDRMFPRTDELEPLDPSGEFRLADNYGEHYSHILAVHKRQYTRLCEVVPKMIPKTKFVVVKRLSPPPPPSFDRELPSWWRQRARAADTFPLVIQESVEGASLGGTIIDRQTGKVENDWVRHMPGIAAQLRYMNKVARGHIDWNIDNFKVSTDRNVFYVDCKPSFMIPEHSNRRNLSSLKECVLRRY